MWPRVLADTSWLSLRGRIVSGSSLWRGREHDRHGENSSDHQLRRDRWDVHSEEY